MTVPTMLCRKLRTWRACQCGARASLRLALLGTTVFGSTRPASLQVPQRVRAVRPPPAGLSDSVTCPSPVPALPGRGHRDAPGGGPRAGRAAVCTAGTGRRLPVRLGPGRALLSAWISLHLSARPVHTRRPAGTNLKGAVPPGGARGRPWPECQCQQRPMDGSRSRLPGPPPAQRRARWQACLSGLNGRWPGPAHLTSHCRSASE